MQCCLPVTVICDLDSTEESPPVVDFTVKQAFAKHMILVKERSKYDCLLTYFEMNILNV